MSDVIHCKDCKYQIKTWHDDMRFKDNGYFTYWCRLNDDLFVGHAITGRDEEFCSSAKPKSERTHLSDMTIYYTAPAGAEN